MNQRFWVVKDEKGKANPKALRDSREGARQAFLALRKTRLMGWYDFVQCGYRITQVELREVGE